jgi:hypothetical protein
MFSTAQSEDSGLFDIDQKAVSKVKRSKRGPVDYKDLGVIDQIRVAFKGKNKLAATVGFLLGGLMPVGTYFVVHKEIDPAVALYTQIATYMVVGGLLFSAITVFEWCNMAFRMWPKALGWVLLAESIMTFTKNIPWLAWAALFYLVMINGVATSCILALPKQKKEEFSF